MLILIGVLVAEMYKKSFQCLVSILDPSKKKTRPNCNHHSLGHLKLLELDQDYQQIGS
jgi:hypothetical protein